MADAPLRACQYLLIRLAPNPIRDEEVTIGVALFEPQAGGFTGVRLLPDWQPVRQLAPQFDPADLDGLQADLLARLGTQSPAWLAREYFLNFARESFSHTLRLSDPRLVLTADPAAELEKLYQQYASPIAALPVESEVARGARRRVLLHLRRVFSEERILSRLARNVRAGEWLGTPDRFRFDFHYQEAGRARGHHVLQSLPWSSGEGAIKELCFTVERVRRHLGGFDVAAFHDDNPAPDAAYAAALLTEAGVRMLPLAEAPGEAARIRAALGLR